MLEKLSEKFAGKLVSAEVISEADADVYMYGFFQAVMLIINVITTLLLGIIFQSLIPCILLNIAYIPIRSSAGGHHADSPRKCYINSTIIIAVLLAIIKWGSINYVVSISMLAISSIVILIFAPVETESNPLDDIEKKVYRRRTLIILTIEIIAYVGCFVFAKQSISTIIALSLFTEALMLLVGIYKNKK